MIFVFTTIKINNNLKILQRFTSKKLHSFYNGTLILKNGRQYQAKKG